MHRLLLVAAALPAVPAFAQDKTAVLATYADIALAGYEDSLTAARKLDTAIDALIAAPSEATLNVARESWIAARVPYQQTEVFRFGNAIVDDWEGRVNAWPLDEGLIDYVAHGGATDENPHAGLNVIANPAPMIGGQVIDAAVITLDLITGTLNEADGIETNVARGYHAIEFLLWGQDLNGTGQGAGNRPATDYATGDTCTGGNCDRRAAYLAAASDVLVADLAEMVTNWTTDGAARQALLADPDAGVIAMLTGMGSLSYGEQAGERMRLGLLLNDPEEEHDCFSDNTHASHFHDGLGVQNVYLGHYRRIDGTLIEGASLSDLVAATDPALDAEMRGKLDTTMAALGAIVAAAEAGMAYDQMLDPANAEGAALVMAGVDALIDQTQTVGRIVTALGVEPIAFEGSDSLDDPGACSNRGHGHDLHAQPRAAVARSRSTTGGAPVPPHEG